MANITEPSCHADFYASLGQQASFVVYFCMTPIYLVFGLFGHLICIRAFLKQWKTERAYMFQIFTTVSEGCLVLAHTGYIVVYWWPRGSTGLSPRFQACYPCMWVSTHVVIALDNAMITTTQLFSTCLALDRFRALLKPLEYKDPTKRAYWACVAFCILVGFSTSAFQTFDNKVIVSAKSPGSYQSAKGSYFDDSILQALSYFRNAIRILALLILYFCNILIPYLYRKRLIAAKQKNILPNSTEKQRRSMAKMLTMLAISECALVTVGMSALVAFYTWLYMAKVDECYGSKSTLYAAALDGLLEMTTTMHFYLLMLLSREFRRLIKDSLRFCCCGEAGTSVQPVVR